jgi:hypothetical protein
MSCERFSRAIGTIAIALAALAFAPGCVRRTIDITSEPAGAMVWLNDEQLGRTPVQTDFKFYGTYDVRLSLDGYEPLSTSAEAVAPFYEYPGPDLLVAPLPLHNRIAWHFELKPTLESTDKPAAERAIIDRGRALRASVSPAPADAPATSAPAPSPDSAPAATPAPAAKPATGPATP